METGASSVRSLLAAGVRCLRGSLAETGKDGAALDASVLLAHALGRSRAWLISHAEAQVERGGAEHYRALIGRRCAGEPIAYLVGYKEFWSIRLQVTPAVLVPRPETELLVERALALGPTAVASVAELGAGSGAIALALALERPDWRITATDICAAALEVVRANAAALGVAGLELAQGHWLAPLAGRTFDLIVSNPPYIAREDPALASPSLRYEPIAALTPGPDALAALRHIARGASAHLAPGGWLLLEHGATQGGDVARELVAQGFARVRCHCDLAGRERVTEAQWPRLP